MPPYSRRPPAIDPHPVPLGSGDFEAVSYNEQYEPYGPPSVRPPPSAYGSPMSSRPPMPVFHQPPPRSVRTGYGAFGGNQPPPAAPNSLSPVALAANNAGATGPQRAQAQETFVIRSRPNLRTGFSILLAGALLGGVIGITARARQNAADAAFAANHQIASDPPPAAASAPPSSTTPLPGILQQPPPSSAPTQPPVVVAANSKDSNKEKDKKPPAHVGWGFGGGAKAAPHTFAGNVKPSEGPKEKDPPAATGGKGKKAGKDDDDGYTIASADNGKEKEKEKAASAKEASASSSSSSKDKDKDKDRDRDADSGKKSGGGKKSNSKDDAADVLKAAMGATANTL